MSLPVFSTDEELRDKIKEYLDTVGAPTITGLAYFLGFSSRQSFYDYEKNEKHSYTIKRARLYMESVYEANLIKANVAGAIFALKNFGWTDKQEIDQKTEHSGSIDITWQEPNLPDTNDKGSNGELQGV